MKITSFSEFQRDLDGTIDSVIADHQPVVITRDRGRPAAVLMSLEDFASYEETRYLLRSPANAEHLLESIAELEAGQGVETSLIE
ncbi:type II toxin-antitoxin system Phd/YefM family antitoxin [Beijerinckia sp. L45]|uniref:type II toxin-antitoxin system Phd/YefM family antitoxin n=1 Tax=Beijerinckia sp. L45 TaxID=1641855 RepID=UPI00131E5A29|nr:type II toxin-antitoxin system prevent-host-death family antitoxin [Beijerinckia sp. L45]